MLLFPSPTCTMFKQLPFSMCLAKGQTWCIEHKPLLQGPNLAWESKEYRMLLKGSNCHILTVKTSTKKLT